MESKKEKKRMSKFLELNQIFHKDYIIYAHTLEKGGKETLQEHIYTCEKYFEKLCKDKKIEKVIKQFCSFINFEHKEQTNKFLTELAYQLIVFHDLGKCNPVFQTQIMKNENYLKRSFEGVSGSNHSMLSAIFYLDYFYGIIESNPDFTKDEKKKLKVLLLEHSFVIARHHSDFQAFTDYCTNLKTDDIKNILSLFNKGEIEVYKRPASINYDNLEKILRSYERIKRKNTHHENLTEYFYYRFLYSLLVSCDYYATGEVCSGIVKTEFGSFHNIHDYKEVYCKTDLITGIREFEQKKLETEDYEVQNITDINELRNCMFLETEKQLIKSLEESIYFLEAPTGSGKSNMALNLSFHMMKDKNKLFYIYPFNTLVEQNRVNLEKIFSEKELSEQITVVNSLTPIKIKNQETDSREYYQKALLDRQFLNYPIILSTHVSFFNTLFSCKKEDLFGFLQLMDAVIVLDEIQSYKNSIWAEMILSLKACADLMGMKIIIMSATLPNLEVLADTEFKVKYLMEDSQKYFQHYLFRNRVKISYELLDSSFSLEILLKHIEDNYSSKKRILVEFISKQTTEKFFGMLCDSEKITVPKYCITGDDSIYEREKILKPIRSHEIEECILIATQVVEAGVDIDMDIGYKDISKLDSEEQFLGRINRSFRGEGIAYFFDLDCQEQIYKNDYRISKDLTLKSLEMREILENKDFAKYYKEILRLIKINRNQSTQEEGLDEFYREIKGLNYEKIEKRMKLIDDNLWNIDIYLSRIIDGEGGEILNGEEIWNRYKELLMADMDYAEKQVKLSDIRSKMNYFIYSVKKNSNLCYNDVIGELRFIQDGEKYFINGKLNRNLLDSDSMFF